MLLTLDTLNLDYVGSYHPGVELTPRIDRLARRGVRFQNVHTPVPLTLPAHTTLLSGLSPTTSRVMLNGDVAPESLLLLPERLKAAGYSTAAFVSLGVLKAHYGLSQGFDVYDSELDELGRGYRHAGEVVDAAEAWLDRHLQDSFFMWVHLSDPHEPYVAWDQPPNVELRLDGVSLGRWNLSLRERETVDFDLPPGRHTLEWQSLRRLRRKGLRQGVIQLDLYGGGDLEGLTSDPLPPAGELVGLEPTYAVELRNPDANDRAVRLRFRGRLRSAPQEEVIEEYSREVAAVDRAIGRLRSDFEDAGIADGTLWVVVSDHGEGLFSHQALGHAAYTYEDQLRVAWIMAGPGLPRGRVVTEPVRSQDVLPTLLDLLRLDDGGGESFDGVSRAGCWRGDCPPTEPWWSYGAGRSGKIAAIAGFDWPYKALLRRGRERGVYDIEADPEESEPLADDGGPRIRRLAGEIDRRLAGFSRALETRSKRELSPDELDTLRGLGYVH